VLVGPAGIGKTTLLEHCVRSRDHVIVRCLLAFSSREYRPLSHALAQPFLGSPEDVATDVLAAVGDQILAVEDLHWADAGTLAVVHTIIGRVPMIVSSRASLETNETSFLELIEVSPLDRRQADELVRRRHPELGDDQRSLVVAAAAGNPFLLENLSRDGSVSPTFRAAIADRIAQLSNEVVDELEGLALHGAPSPAGGFPALESGVDGITAIAADGNIWFSHDLFRAALQDSLSHDRVRRLRLDLADRLPDADAAHHLFALGEFEEAARRARCAAESADPITRAELLALAVDALGESSPARSLLDAAAAAIDAHRPAEARRFASKVVGGDEEIAEASLHRARADWLEGNGQGAFELVEHALRSVAGTSTVIEARLTVERAFISVRHRVGDQSIIPLADAAVDVAVRCDVDRARALNTAGLARSHLGREGWQELFAAAYDAAMADGDDEELFASRYWLLSALGFYGPMAEAIALGAEMVATTERLGARRWYHHFLGAHVVHLSARGDIPDAVLEDCERLLHEAPLFRNRAQVELALASAFVDRGSLEQCAKLIGAGQVAVRSDEDIALLACARCELALAQRDLGGMREALAAIVSSGASFFGLNAVAESAAIHLAYSHPGELAPPTTVTTLTPVLDAVAIEREAHERQLQGDIDGAIQACGAAAEAWERRGLQRFARRALLGRAEISVAAGDLERAARLLATMAHSTDVTGRRRESLGFEITRMLARRAVTDRELEVLHLVGAGLTTVQIAGQLGISVSTVNSHVVAAMRRLGARTRVQAASLIGFESPDRTLF
jgi:DNA-binding CsgD family transcriptional regulator/tetratricopeptide (TPR) repeat protein